MSIDHKENCDCFDCYLSKIVFTSQVDNKSYVDLSGGEKGLADMVCQLARKVYEQDSN